MGIKILSQHPEFRGRELKQYPLDGVNTVGVFGNEPFAIRVNNPYGEKILVIISVDGRNVLTGRQAVLDPHSRDAFVLPAYATRDLSAWVEDRQGGAQFVFTDEANGVALHTPGGLEAVGYISVAVLREGYVLTPPPVSRLPRPWENDATYRDRQVPYGDGLMAKGVSGPAVGAGDRVSQQIGTASGLIRPEYRGEVWQVRHLWWDTVREMLRAAGVEPSPRHPTGFAEKLADLGSTPRVIVGGDHDRYSNYQPAPKNREYQRLA